MFGFRKGVVFRKYSVVFVELVIEKVNTSTGVRSAFGLPKTLADLFFSLL